MPGLRKIRVHIRVLYDSLEDEKRIRPRSRTSSSSSYGRHDDGKRRPSVRFDTRLQTTPIVLDPPHRYQDLELPKSAGSIEYFPIDKRDGEGSIRLARLQRQSSVTYPRGDSPETTSKTYMQRSVSTSGHERGRSRRRVVSNIDDADNGSDEADRVKLEHSSKQ